MASVSNWGWGSGFEQRLDFFNSPWLKVDFNIQISFYFMIKKTKCWITDWMGLEGRSPGPTLLLKQGHLKPLAHDCVQSAFEYLQGGELHNLYGQPVPVLSHPRGKEVFPHVQTEPPMFRFVPTASGLVTGHHWKEPGSVFFAPSLQVFIYVDMIPLSLLFSRLKSPSSLRLSSHEKCLSPNLVALRWTLSSMFVSVLC